MSLLNIVSLAAAMVTVDYLGGTVAIPKNHEWVAMTKLDCSNGESKGLLVSYEVEPTVSRNGYYVAVPGTEHRILGEVEYQDPRGSLRRVQGHNQVEAIYANAEELTYKMIAVLEQADSQEDAIHVLFCPEHGVMSEFLRHTVPMLDQYYEAVENPAKAEGVATQAPEFIAPQAKEGPRVINLTGGPVPNSVLEIMAQIGAILKADGHGRA